MKDNVKIDNVHIEEMMMAECFNNLDYLKKISEYLKTKDYNKKSYFTDPKDQLIFNVLANYSNKYSRLPKEKELKSIFDNLKERDPELSFLVNILLDKYLSYDTDQYSKDYVIQETETFINTASIYEKIVESSVFLSGGEVDETFDLLSGTRKISLTENINDIKKISSSTSREELDAFFSSDLNQKKISSLYDELDRTLRGGFKEGKLYCVAGASGAGKSIVLQQLCINSVKQDFKALFVSLEMDEKTIMERFYTNILPDTYKSYEDLEIASSTNKEQLYDDIEESQKDIIGNMEVRFPLELGTTANDIRRMVEGKEYDIIFVDYLGILQNNDKTQQDNSHMKYKMISEELRKIAKEFKIPVVTALQISREGYKNGKQLEVTDIGYSIGIGQTADFICGIANNGTELHIIKNRDGSKDPLSININYPKYKIDSVKKGIVKTDTEINEVIKKITKTEETIKEKKISRNTLLGKEDDE